MERRLGINNKFCVDVYINIYHSKNEIKMDSDGSSTFGSLDHQQILLMSQFQLIDFLL
jgi:hypothetical protein